MKNENLNTPNVKRSQRRFNVYLNGKWIDTIYYGASTNVDSDEVKQSLINHDGYDSRIIVKEDRPK